MYYGNRRLSTAGLNGTQRPDIITVRIEKGCKIYDIYEYASPSQKRAQNDIMTLLINLAQ